MYVFFNQENKPKKITSAFTLKKMFLFIYYIYSDTGTLLVCTVLVLFFHSREQNQVLRYKETRDNVQMSV